MKLHVMRLTGYNVVGFYEKPPVNPPGCPQYEPLGTIEVEEPKKTVTKGAMQWPLDTAALPGEYNLFKFCVPFGARNIKCTYEIEE